MKRFKPQRETCLHPGCEKTYSIIKWGKHSRRFYTISVDEVEKIIQQGIKTVWLNKGLCALHYDRRKRGTDMDAPIRPANINKIITG